MTPNFFIAGAPKAGTDALYYDLDQHPEIYMSPLKEPCYFSSEIRLENFEPSQREGRKLQRESIREYVRGPMLEKRFGGIVYEWDDYLRLFAGAKEQKAIGEGSVCYLWSRTAAPAIAARLPCAKIIIVLMNPAERAFAQYLKSLSNGSVTHSFREHLDAALQLQDTRLSLLHPFLDFGMYAEQVRRYQEVFPEQQLNISFFEDAQQDPARWFAQILEFLGVDPAFVPKSGCGNYHAAVPRFARVNQTLRAGGILKSVRRSIPEGLRKQAKKLLYRQPESLAMTSSERAALIAFYREDVEKLQDLLERDLSGWLR
jgi:hypothetical protein